MRRAVTALIGGLALAGCDRPPTAAPTSLPDQNRYWYECKFELDKVEAIRGRNLDDLNSGIGNATNQFLVDCMGSKTAKITDEQMKELTAYKSRNPRDPHEMNINRVGVSGQ